MRRSRRSVTTCQVAAARMRSLPRASVHTGLVVTLAGLLWAATSCGAPEAWAAGTWGVGTWGVGTWGVGTWGVGSMDAGPGWTLPVPGGRVVRSFDTGPYPWSPGHRGVDFPAREGLPVRTPSDGVIAFSGSVAGRGVVVVEHVTPNAVIRSSFEPVLGLLAVGSPVHQGQVVAQVQFSGAAEGTTSGADHCSASSCVHWGVRRGTTYLDPLSLIGVRPVVLLPLFTSPVPS